MKRMIHVLLFSGLCVFIQNTSCKVILIKQEMTWDNAQAHCREHYGDLATVQSTEDRAKVQEIIGAERAWTGLYNDIHSWRWSHRDEPFSFSIWSIGQPNNVNAMQECGAVYAGMWHDMTCSETTPFICFNENQVGANRFVLVTSPLMSWPDAQTYCRQHHTDLATIRTPAENDQVTSMTDSYPYIWIGLFRDSWKWSDGINASMSSINLVNKRDITGQNRPCGVTDNSGVIDDWLCSTLCFFICKLGVKKQIVRLEVKSALNVNDPAMMEAILQPLKQKLKYYGIEDTTTWRLQADGNVFTPKEEINQQ